MPQKRKNTFASNKRPHSFFQNPRKKSPKISPKNSCCLNDQLFRGGFHQNLVFFKPEIFRFNQTDSQFPKTEDFISMKNSPFEALKGYVSDLPKRAQESIRLHINHPSLLIQLILWDRNIILIKIPKQMVTIYVPSIVLSLSHHMPKDGLFM